NGINAQNNEITIDNVWVKAFTSRGLLCGGGSVTNSRVSSMKSGALAAVYSNVIGGFFNTGCADNNPCTGFDLNQPVRLFGCVSYNNTGGTSVRGFSMVTTTTNYYTLVACVAYGNGGDGIYWNPTTPTTVPRILNCVLVGNGQAASGSLYGVNFTTSVSG